MARSKRSIVSGTECLLCTDTKLGSAAHTPECITMKANIADAKMALFNIAIARSSEGSLKDRIR
jgi:hypothetical protein